jgi:predicted nucleotidyltransferase
MKLECHSALRKIEGNVDTDLLQKDPFLRKLVDLFVKEYRPERIYLFGSKARGEAGCYSDYDVMIIVPDDTPKSIRETGRAHKLMWKADLTEPVDVLVWSKSRFEAVTHLKASLPAVILEEGTLLYAA